MVHYLPATLTQACLQMRPSFSHYRKTDPNLKNADDSGIKEKRQRKYLAFNRNQRRHIPIGLTPIYFTPKINKLASPPSTSAAPSPAQHHFPIQDY